MVYGDIGVTERGDFVFDVVACRSDGSRKRTRNDRTITCLTVVTFADYDTQSYCHVAVILGGIALGLFGILVPVFSIPVVGSLVLFFVLSILYVSTLAGIGILIATVTNNMAQAGMMVILILAPMMFLSGAWTPPEAMPTIMRLGMYASPLYYYINASYGILMKGAGAMVLWPMFFGILLIGVLVSTATILKFKKQFG